jgi:hypothetical protein
MGGARDTLKSGTQMRIEFRCGKLYSLKDTGDDERLILKQILKKEDGKELSEFIWLRTDATAVLW